MLPSCLGSPWWRAGACLLAWLVPGLVGNPVPPLGPRVVAGEVLRRKAAARDWKKYPAVVEVRTSQDVFALGDVHGDYDRLVALLVAGKVIPKGPAQPDKVRWAAGRAVLVCTGIAIAGKTS